MCELRHIPQLQHINESNNALYFKGLENTAKQILAELSDVKYTSQQKEHDQCTPDTQLCILKTKMVQ